MLNKTKLFFYISLLSQTTTTQDLIDWFSSFLPVVTFLFMFICIVMFIYAVLKAPLEVLKKAFIVSSAWSLVGFSTRYFESIVSTLFSLLSLFFMFLLPLILILLLYRSFFALVREK